MQSILKKKNYKIKKRQQIIQIRKQICKICIFIYFIYYVCVISFVLRFHFQDQNRERFNISGHWSLIFYCYMCTRRDRSVQVHDVVFVSTNFSMFVSSCSHPMYLLLQVHVIYTPVPIPCIAYLLLMCIS